MITHIQDITGATIQVPLASESGADYVTISGQREEVEAATAMVDQLRARITDGGSTAAASTSSFAIAPSNPTNPATTTSIITTGTTAPTPAILGTPPRSSHASLPTSPTTAASPIHSPSAGITDLEVEAAEVILEVAAPEKFHRYLIGARGTTMKQIQNESGAMIFFPNTKNAPARVRPSSEDVVTIVGTNHACDRAQELILARVTDCHSDTGGSRDSAYLRLLHDMRERRQTQEFAGEVQVKVASELHGFVVGGVVRAFRQKFTTDDAIGSHACSA
jgi:hypothetical protein